MTTPSFGDRHELPTQAPTPLEQVSASGLAVLLHQDQQRRWAAGEQPSVEDYLRRYPQLHDNRDLVIALLVQEVLLRQQAGEQPLEDLAARFPDHAEAVRGVLSLERFLLDEVPGSEMATVAPKAPSVPERDEAAAGTADAPPTRLDATASQDAHLPLLSVPGYAVQGVLGKGGMGVVYKAQQIALRRTVALKMILHADHAGADERRRFQAEAEAVAQLQHPNIVQVHEVGEHKGVPYFSLEFCPGGSLETQLDGTPWEPKRAAALVQTLAQAMHAAHQAGLVHRDLKPGNVLLTADGTPKITDFGLVKRLDVQGNTQTGAVVGTPSYMAPEQAGGKGKEVGPAADVYTLGAILYELLTGRPPFRAATVLETVYQVLHTEPVPVRRLQPKTPKDLETICHQCLEKEPGKRYASAAALADDLRRFSAGEPVTARPVGAVSRLAKWAQRRPAVAALVLAVTLVAGLGLGGILWAYGEAVQQRRAVEKEAERTSHEKERADANAADARSAAEQAKEKAAAAEREKQAALWQTYMARVGRADAQILAGELPGAMRTLDSIELAQRGWECRLLRRRAEGTRLTLRGHTAPVFAVAFSPDGSHLATASNDGTVKVWDVTRGTELATLRGHRAGVGSVAYSPDGSRIASGSGDGTVKVWDANSGTEITTLRGHTDSVHCVAYSPDGSRLATGDNQKAKVWDTKTNAEVVTLRGHTDSVMSVAYSPDGSRIATASGNHDRTVKVWDAKSGTEIATLRGHTAQVFSVAFSSDGSYLTSASYDGVRVWDAKNGGEVLNLGGKGSTVLSVAYSPDGSRIACASDDTVKVWDARSGTEVLTLRGHSARVNSVVYSPDGSRMATASDDQTVKVWDTNGGREVPSLQGHAGAVTCVTYSRDGSHIASASSDNTVKVWDAKSGTEIATLRGHTACVNSVAFSPDGSRLASGSEDKMVKVWDAKASTEIATLRGHTAEVLGGVRSVAYSPDGSRLASASWNSVKVWDAKTGTEVVTLRGHSHVAYSPDGSRIASASGGGTVKVWDAKSGTEVMSITLRARTGVVPCVTYSPDGSRIISSSDDGVQVWDARSGIELLTLQGHRGRVPSVASSPDDSRIATASFDNTVKVWDAKSGNDVLTLHGHAAKVYSVAFSPDGTRLASASGDETVKVWDASNGSEDATLCGHAGLVYSVAYSPDGLRLASASADETVKVWDVKRGTEVATLRGHTGEVFSVAYSADGSRLVSTDARNKTLVWDAIAGTLRPQENPPPRLTDSNVSPDGRFVAVTDNDVIRIWRRPGAGEHDPWEEDQQRRGVQNPLWHAERVSAAYQRGDSFAETFHRRCLTQGDNLRILAWAKLARGDHKACQEMIHSLHDRRQALVGLTSAGPLFSALTGGPLPVMGAAPVSPLEIERRRLTTLLARTAALVPDSSFRSADLVALARSCVEDDPQSWQARELLGAALYRDGKAAEAATVLDQAGRLHTKGGSLWTKLFLALAHQRLGHRDEADEWQKKADKAGPWEEQVMQFQLLGELEGAKRPARP
jgi:WD40 repeat protein